MSASLITYQGRKILFVDYQGLKKNEEMLSTLHQAVGIADQSPEKLRTLIDITNSCENQEWMKESKRVGKEMREKAEKTAIVGVQGVRKVLQMGYNTAVGGKVKSFTTKEAALAYLNAE